MKMDNYITLSKIGRGTFGSVHICVKKGSDRKYVVKEIQFDLNDHSLEIAQGEVLILSLLHHPNIITYYDSFLFQKSLYIIMEYANKGTLYEYLKYQPGPLKLDNVLDIFCQILLALNHMHINNILHRDLKSENILLAGRKGEIVKVADFGISKLLPRHDGVADTLKGTANYLAPEVCRGEKYGIKSDIWALGCILYELCMQERMFEGALANVIMNISNGNLKKIDIKQYPENIHHLINEMCAFYENERPQTENLMARKFLIPYVYKQPLNLGKIDKC